jgi:hypothetical protein
LNSGLHACKICTSLLKSHLQDPVSIKQTNEKKEKYQNKNKRAGGMAQVAEGLPSMHRPWVQSQVLENKTKQKQGKGPRRVTTIFKRITLEDYNV